MVTIIIDYESEELPSIEVTFESGIFVGKTFRSTLNPCGIQTCECGNIYVDFELVTSDKENEESDEMEVLEDDFFCGHLNINENEVDIYSDDFDFESEPEEEDDTESLISMEEAFATQLSQELTSEDWSTLYGFFLAMKTVGSEMADPEHIIAEFNRFEVEEGLPIGYSEVFPYAMPESMPIGEVNYLMNDAYYLQSGSRTTEVSLIITPFMGEELKLTDPDAMDEVPELIVKYNYITKDIQVVEEMPESLHTTEVLLDTLRGLEEVAQRFGERHQRMRKIYQSYLKRVGVEFNSNPKKMLASRNVTAPPKLAGRNDPCPCGSGKKYKKCCGA
ncbi:MAG: SEC-C metal-binding domain-containing protein [Bacteroidota bacterium]